MILYEAAIAGVLYDTQLLKHDSVMVLFSTIAKEGSKNDFLFNCSLCEEYFLPRKGHYL